MIEGIILEHKDNDLDHLIAQIGSSLLKTFSILALELAMASKIRFIFTCC
jgi:hypothetical protein